MLQLDGMRDYTVIPLHKCGGEVIEEMDSTDRAHSVVNQTQNNEWLAVSLVIPVRNEELSLPVLLDSIRRQTSAPDEVIFVDGGSSDKTIRFLQELAVVDASVRVIETGGATPGRGRNVGIAAAKNEWIALTDAGIRLEATWLQRLKEAAMADSSTQVVYGNYEPIGGTFFERSAALAYCPIKQLKPDGWIRGPSTASLLIRRNVWHQAGGIPDLRASEDLIFFERIAAGGFIVRWAPEATAWWQIQPTLGSTFRRCRLYSMHNALAGRQRHWHYGVLRIYLIAGVLLCLGAVSAWWLLAIPLGVAVRAGKSIWMRRDGRSILWACSPFQFVAVTVILLTLDLATFVGWIQALITPSLRRKADDTQNHTLPNSMG
jgi:glycosyltransferase involved in cell wall biosynthesis